MTKNHDKYKDLSSVGNPESSPEPSAGNKRRQLITRFAAGGGLSLLAAAGAKWRTPVVEGVILPAHAQTSVELGVFDPCTLGLTNLGDGGTQVTVTGTLVGPADQIGGVNGTVEVVVRNCGNSVVDDQTNNVTTNSNGAYSTSFIVSGPDRNYYLATTTFPGIGTANCPGIKGVCG